MSYAPFDRNVSGIAFFGTSATDQVFESSSSFTIGNSYLTSPNIKVSNGGYIGNASNSGIIKLDSNGLATFSNDVTIGGDLIVNGTQVILNTETLNIEDNNILLNSNVSGEPTLDAGITVERGTSNNVAILWNETSDSWTFTNDGTVYFGIAASGSSLSVDNVTLQNISGVISVKDGGVTEVKRSRSVDSTFTNSDTISSDINLVNASGSNVSLYLPVPASGKLVIVKKIDSGSGYVNIQANSAEKIDGSDAKILYYQYEALTFVSDGTNWFVV